MHCKLYYTMTSTRIITSAQISCPNSQYRIREKIKGGAVLGEVKGGAVLGGGYRRAVFGGGG